MKALRCVAASSLSDQSPLAHTRSAPDVTVLGIPYFSSGDHLTSMVASTEEIRSHAPDFTVIEPEEALKCQSPID